MCCALTQNMHIMFSLQIRINRIFSVLHALTKPKYKTLCAIKELHAYFLFLSFHLVPDPKTKKHDIEATTASFTAVNDFLDSHENSFICLTFFLVFPCMNVFFFFIRQCNVVQYVFSRCSDKNIMAKKKV